MMNKPKSECVFLKSLDRFSLGPEWGNGRNGIVAGGNKAGKADD
jgi:hypothetical protein